MVGQTNAKRAVAVALRNRVFVQEQRVFTDHDRDAIDDCALPLVAIAEGVQAGERVVVRGNEALRDGQPVQPGER